MNIIYWADTTWMLAEEYNKAEYDWKGHNYSFLEVPIGSTDLVIDEIVRDKVN